MRLLQIIGSIAPSFGGPALGSVALNQALNERGVETHILSGAYFQPGEPGSSVDMADFLLPDGAHGRVLPAARPYTLENFRAVTRVLRDEMRTIDGVHIHGLHGLPGLLAAVLCVRRGIPYGVQPHGNFEPYQAARSRVKKRLAWWAYTRWVVRNAKYVLVASETEAGPVLQASGHPNVIVSPLGAQLAPITIPDPKLVERVQRAGRSRCVAFVGRLASKKRPDLLIKAWALASEPECLLVIAGPDGEHSRDELARLASDLGIGDRVLLTGPLYGGEKTWLLEACGVFALPSENENFGVAVAEAMLAGSCILTTHQVAAGTHVARASGGTLVEASDFDALVAALQEMLRDEAATAMCGRNARRYAERTLRWANVADKIISQCDDSHAV